jgi:hypothetical protein
LSWFEQIFLKQLKIKPVIALPILGFEAEVEIETVDVSDDTIHDAS